MNIEFGNSKQIMVSLVLFIIIVLATVSTHMANVHLAFTIFIGGINVYLGYQLGNDKVRPKNNIPAAYVYIFAFGINAIICFAFSWWFSGIVWAYILCIYFAVNQPKKKKEQDNEPVKKSNEGEVS
jgi:predicted membrane protein